MGRQAVVIIHGIGEQRPMDTLRAFVLGVLGRETDKNGKQLFYSKPDSHSPGFELRRYRAFDEGHDSDFVEFYWQHKMPIGSWGFILGWLWLLMRRPAAAMPPRFLILWWICWIALVALVLTAVAIIIAKIYGYPVSWLALPTLGGALGIAAGAAGYVVRSFVGDAAIYLNPSARTVEARNAIRTEGVALLERLQSDDRYDRVIVVGHSLGSVIGYDILNFAWQKAGETLRRAIDGGTLAKPIGEQPCLSRSETLAKSRDTLTDTLTSETWLRATRALYTEQRALGVPWCVTDFITLGSPLAHSSLLLAMGAADLDRRTKERELPTCPPFLEDGAHFSYERNGKTKDEIEFSARVIDHAAVFAVTVWTNLYFPCHVMLYGDLVGGPIGSVLGAGIADIAVETSVRGGWLSHTKYWSRYQDMSAKASPLQLIDALDLTRQTFR